MKNVFILGDSYSTFKGHIPEGFGAYYPDLGVDTVEKTWWHTVIRETGVSLTMNHSYSGTTVCHTGYDGKDRKTISFLGRLRHLAEEGFFEKNKIDELWIFGGTNDSWANSPMGEILYEGIGEEKNYEVLPAFSSLLSLAKALPVGKVLAIVNCDLKKEIEQGYAEIAAHYGVPALQLQNIEKKNGHPNQNGMAQIAEQFIAFREKNI